MASEGTGGNATSSLGDLGPGEAMAAAHALSLPADQYGNDPNVEMIWAMKAYQHAEVYFNLISSVDPKHLKLTKVDDVIYSDFRTMFNDLKIGVLDPDELKSETAKQMWRPFCMRFDGIVEDFNYGTLLRLDCKKDYTDENTIFISSKKIEVMYLRGGRDVIHIIHTGSSKILLLTRPEPGTRIQFLAIEIARNREGLNHFVFSEAAKAKPGPMMTEKEQGLTETNTNEIDQSSKRTMSFVSSSDEEELLKFDHMGVSSKLS